MSFAQKFTSPVYRRLFKYVWPRKYQFFLGILGGAIYSGIDAYFTHLMKPILDKGFIDKDQTFIKFMPFVIVGIFIVRGFANFMGNYFMSRVGRNIVMDLRNAMFAKLIHVPSQFFDQNTTGQLLSKIIYNVDQVADAATNAITIAVQSIVLIMGLLVVMFFINWRLTLIYLVALPLIMVIVRYSSKRMRRVSMRVQNALGVVGDISEEAIEGFREVRMFGGETEENKKFAAATRNNLNQAMKVVVSKSISSSFVQLVGAVVLAYTIYLATSNHLVSNTITPGGFVALLVAMVMLLKPLKDFTNVNNIIQQGLAGAESVFELLDKPIELDAGKEVIARVKGSIEFRAVSFSYQTSQRPVLKNISFTIKPGETVALVGRSGSGKSSLISLLPRFYEPETGTILIDNIDIKQLTLTNLRDQIALVSQRVVLFNDSVAKNIAYGSLNDRSESEIWDAVDKAHAREFIERLPQGLHTIIGENGITLSGGQRQRLAIARAILKNAPILILDEATSSLDSHAERYIQAALEDLIVNRTTLVIAHRLSTIENADKILVMDQGEIVEVGTHQELLAKGAYYSELYQSQFYKENSGDNLAEAIL